MLNGKLYLLKSYRATERSRRITEHDYRIEQFENKFNLAMCRSLYGEDEGLRLFTHFRKDCTKSPFKQFETYLDSRQMNLLYEYLMTSILFDN